MATILEGKILAEKILQDLKVKMEYLHGQYLITPRLTTILIGEDPAAKVYINSKTKKCASLGIETENITFGEDADESVILNKIDELNKNKTVHGILLQLPLPKKYNTLKIINAISPLKDVDGFHPVNLGKLIYNQAGFAPCTPLGIMRLLKDYKITIEGKNAVIIGRSNIVGKPLSILLLNENATVTVCHSKTKDLIKHALSADILISAIGKPNFVTANMVSEGSCVIDVGINKVNGKTTGDVDFEKVKEKAAYITPVPGGVGPLTIAMLLSNTVLAAQRAAEFN